MKKLLALLLCLVMLISFAACSTDEGSSENGDSQNDEGQTELSSVEQIKQSGKLRLGTSADYRPLNTTWMSTARIPSSALTLSLAN